MKKLNFSVENALKDTSFFRYEATWPESESGFEVYPVTKHLYPDETALFLDDSDSDRGEEPENKS